MSKKAVHLYKTTIKQIPKTSRNGQFPQPAETPGTRYKIHY